MKNFTIQSELGNGSFGKVNLAIHIPTGDKVAIKTISKQKLKTKEDVQMVNKQISVFKSVHHGSIIKLFEIVEDQANLYLVMEYADKGDLLSFIKSNGTLSEMMALNFMRQIAEAVEYLHYEKCIAHRDIKLANILLSSKNHTIKLADFGLSNFYDKEKNLLKTSCGSPCYSAPEVLVGAKYNPLASDIWSLGVVFYSMIEGCLPFYHENVKQLYKQVIKGRYCQHQKATKQIRCLVKKLLQVNPEQRIKIKDLISEINELISIRRQTQLKEAPKLTRQSSDYVENMKYQTIKKILLFKKYQLAEVNEALQHRRQNKRARKFNQLNTFIQLLERKPFNQLNSFFNSLTNETKQNKGGVQDLTLKRTRSSFTKDTLKGSLVQQKIQNGVRFMRKNGVRQRVSKVSESEASTNHNEEEIGNEANPKIHRKRPQLALSLKQIDENQLKIQENSLLTHAKGRYIRLNSNNFQVKAPQGPATYRSKNSNLSTSFSSRSQQKNPQNSKNNHFLSRGLISPAERNKMKIQMKQQKCYFPLYEGNFNIAHTFNGQIKNQSLLNIQIGLKFKGAEVMGNADYFVPWEGDSYRIQIFKVSKQNGLKYIKIVPFNPEILLQVKKIITDIQITK